MDFILLTHGLVSSKLAFKITEELSQTCFHTMQTISKEIRGATGGVMVNPDGEDCSFVVCGGQDADTRLMHDTCKRLSDPAEKTAGFLQVPRVGAASLVMNNGTDLWVTGGFNMFTFALDTTEFVSLSENSSDDGPILPSGVKYHCLEQVDSKSAILIGGQDVSNQSQSRNYWYDANTMGWIFAKPLKASKAKHACGVIRDGLEQDWKIIVAAGGITINGVMTKTVELMVLLTDKYHGTPWELGPEMPEEVANAASATTSGQQKLLVIGGTTISNKQGTSSVYEMTCWLLECQWKLLEDLGLRSPTAHNLAISLQEHVPQLIWNTDKDNAQCSYFDNNPEQGKQF